MTWPTLTIDQMNAEEDGMYKFVRLSTGEFVFGKFEMTGPEHRQLVPDGATAVAAGVLFLFPDYWRIEQPWSMTLRMGMSDRDKWDLAQLITREQKEVYS